MLLLRGVLKEQHVFRVTHPGPCYSDRVARAEFCVYVYMCMYVCVCVCVWGGGTGCCYTVSN